MNTHDLATIFDSLVIGLGEGLKKNGADELQMVAQMFRKFSNQSLKQFSSKIEKAFAVELLIPRIQQFHDNGEQMDDLKKQIGKLTVNDLKQINKELGLPITGKKDDNKQRIYDYLENGHGDSPQNPDPYQKVNEAYQIYSSIEKNLDRLTIGDIRNSFLKLRQFDKTTIVGLAEKLGYSFRGSKENIENQLLSNLESMKLSEIRTGNI